MNWNKTINTHTGIKGKKDAKSWFIQGMVMALIGVFIFWIIFWPLAAICFYRSYQARKSVV